MTDLHPWLKDWAFPWPARTLTAARCQFEDGVFWTVIDKDTEDLIGSFGIATEDLIGSFGIATKADTAEAALDEAERFGSKWGWPTDRDAVRDDVLTPPAS